MEMHEYLSNRQHFPAGELEKYAGQYVAWSPDGKRIVASSDNLEALDCEVRAAGEDPAQCVIEGVPAYDSVIGASDLQQKRT
ncbi:MAG: DUF5678 domain-containing protein [Pirellulales bacterium]